MTSNDNRTGFILLRSASLTNTALEAIQLGVARPSVNTPINLPAPWKSDEVLRARDEFIRFKLPTFLEGAILEADMNAKCSRLTSLVSGTPIGQIIQTHVLPFIIFFTLVTNFLTAIVLTRPAMRNPTNTLLLGIAIADLFTVLLPLPIYLSSLASNLYREDLSMFKGYAVSYLATLLPTIFHTAAIWMTVLLAIQRFIYVQYPLKANTVCLCQTGPVKLLTCLTVIFALVFQLPQIIFLRYHNALSFQLIDNHTTTTTTQQLQPVVVSHLGPVVLDTLTVVKCTPLDPTFMFILLLCRVAFIHVIPSVSLTILTGQLIVALHRFARNRRKLLTKSTLTTPTTTTTVTGTLDRPEETAMLRQPSRSSYVRNGAQVVPKSLARSNGASSAASASDKDSTSRMMLVVLGIFLLVELPTTGCICFYAFSIILNRAVSHIFFEVMELCNFLVVLSYPANFFVYFAMSRQFRQTFEITFPRCWRVIQRTQSACLCPSCSCCQRD